MTHATILQSQHRPWLIDVTEKFYNQIINGNHVWTSLLNSPDVHFITDRKTIGIEDIRTLQTIVSRKPFQESVVLVVIDQAHAITVPAQNAMLKLLEEPPAYAYFVLWTDTIDRLLPTIRSRATITFDTAPRKINHSEGKEAIDQLRRQSVGERIATLQKQIKDAQSANQFITQLIGYYQQKLQTDDGKNTEAIAFLHKLLDYNDLLKKQVAPKFLCDIIAIHLP